MTNELPPEVIAAAERLRTSAGDWRYMEGSHVYCDIETVCRFIASQQQEAAERDKPIDGGFLRAVGFEFKEYGWAKLGRLAVKENGVWHLNGERLDCDLWPTTRGELLDLLNALGIQVA